MNRVLVLTRAQVESLLDPDALRDAVGRAMADLSAGHADMPPRTIGRAPSGVLAAMTSYLPSGDMLATKLVSVFPGNGALGIPTHHAVIAVFDPRTGAPTAFIDGEAITAARTAAGSALATSLLARPDARIVTIIGTGVQARAHLAAVPRVLPELEEIRVATREESRARTFADEVGAVGCPSYSHALEGADVVCACTHAVDPVVRREWLSPGVHVNSVGVNFEGREVDEATVVDALVVVESRAAALGGPGAGGANEIAWPIRDGVIDESHIHAEIGEIVAGGKPGRTSAGQITLYKSVGVAVQDAAATALVLERAADLGVGSRVEL